MKKGKAGIKPGKPIPTDMREWVREVLGVHKLLGKFDAVNYQPNQAWVDKQHKYWTTRLALLLATKPDIPSRHYWTIIRDYILSKRRGPGRPKKGVVSMINTIKPK